MTQFFVSSLESSRVESRESSENRDSHTVCTYGPDPKPSPFSLAQSVTLSFIHSFIHSFIRRRASVENPSTQRPSVRPSDDDDGCFDESSALLGSVASCRVVSWTRTTTTKLID